MEGFVKTDGSDKLRPPKNENLMPMFKLVSDYRPAGDQPQALEKLAESLKAGKKYQTLLGVTGSGKTFTMANVIEKIQRPVLVISHNKTLAAQLYSEFKSFFPENAVEYFISYYDYYLPESYSPQTDTYIAKDASINEEIEKLRLSATASLLQRRDIIVVASVSCIYGLGSPEDYEGMCVIVKKGEECDRNDFLMELVSIQYDRNDIAPEKGQFRVRGRHSGRADAALRCNDQDRILGLHHDFHIEMRSAHRENSRETRQRCVFPLPPLRDAARQDRRRLLAHPQGDA